MLVSPNAAQLIDFLSIIAFPCSLTQLEGLIFLIFLYEFELSLMLVYRKLVFFLVKYLIYLQDSFFDFCTFLSHSDTLIFCLMKFLPYAFRLDFSDYLSWLILVIDLFNYSETFILYLCLFRTYHAADFLIFTSFSNFYHLSWAFFIVFIKGQP